MAVEAFVLTTAIEISKALGLELLKKFKSDDLRKALDDAIDKIDKNTRKALIDNALRELSAEIRQIDLLLREYQKAPSEGMLNHITVLSAGSVEKSKTLDLLDPMGSGLKGHFHFMMAANLRIAILQERVKNNQKESTNLADFLIDCISHNNFLQKEWEEWNGRQFGQLRSFVQRQGLGGNVRFQIRHYYTFNGKTVWLKTPSIMMDFKSLFGSGTQGRVQITPAAAKTEYLEAIKKEYSKVEKIFVIPSEKVEVLWRKILDDLNVIPAQWEIVIPTHYSLEFKDSVLKNLR